MRGNSGMRRRDDARTAAPRRLLPAGLRLTGWLLAYLLLAHLFLGGVAAGAMAAPGLGDGAGLLCTTHVDASTDGTSDSAPSAQHAPHCVLCPLAGSTPLLPEPAALPAPLVSARVVEVRAPAPRPVPAPPLHESARPRAPPAAA